MYRAITVIELLITLSITVIALYFISPIIFSLQDHILVQREMDNIKAFFYKIQSQARYQQQNYAISIAQNNTRWCIIAVAKNSEKQTACNCLNLSSCQIKNHYDVYYNHFNVSLYNKNFYPKIFTHFDGISGNQSTICLNVSSGNEQAILQIQRNGVMNVITGKTRSRCKETT